MDTGTTGGRLVFHVFAALAEFERALILERTQAGLQAARGRGRKGGRPPKLTDQDKAAAALLADPASTVGAAPWRLGVHLAQGVPWGNRAPDTDGERGQPCPRSP